MLSVLSSKKLKFAGSLESGHFGLKNEIGLVTHQSIGNFIEVKKIYTFRGKKSDNNPSEPKNGIWAPKLV
jgi:hypothetical protein